MFLKRLYEYSYRIEKLEPALYAKLRIAYLIDLDARGGFLGFSTQVGAGPQADRGRQIDAPALSVKRGYKILPMLLADNAQYVLGIAPEGRAEARVADCHRTFVELVELCARQTGNADVQAILTFMQSLDLARIELPPKFDPAVNLTFRVDGRLPVHDPVVQAWWADYSSGLTESAEGQCIVTGRRGRVVKRLPQPIKGVPGGQVSGLPLISMNAEAFESYGLEASYNAPISLDAAERCGKALNELLRAEKAHLRVGPLAYVFWTREPEEISFPDILSRPTAGEVQALLKSPWKGREQRGVEPNAFYSVALSASGGRAVIRDWIESTVPQVLENLRHWFVLMDLVAPDGSPGEPYGIYPLSSSLYRDANRDMVANVPRTLLRCALHGGPLPDWLLAQVVKRNRAEQGVTRPRAALTKIALLSQMDKQKEDYMTELELTNRDPAYLCGRLLAVLEGIQRLAVPGAQATILDRYYGTASSAPATVFGMLLRGAQAHLAKLRKTRKPAYLAITQRIEEITEPLAAFPATLSLKQQALFSLGYYHQRGHDRAAAKAHRELADTAPDTEVLEKEE
jgi:CRISPR-associated protein Csd1